MRNKRAKGCFMRAMIKKHLRLHPYLGCHSSKLKRHRHSIFPDSYLWSMISLPHVALFPSPVYSLMPNFPTISLSILPCSSLQWLLAIARSDYYTVFWCLLKSGPTLLPECSVLFQMAFHIYSRLACHSPPQLPQHAPS